MSRNVVVAVVQSGPIPVSQSRSETIQHLIAFLESAADRGAELVVFGELALTPFFPHWLVEDGILCTYFEKEMPSGLVQPLFNRARQLGVGFYLGYAEISSEGRRFNTAILVDRSGEIVGKYRKVHLPGYYTPDLDRQAQDLEKRYFEPGNLGFPVFEAFHGRIGMCICNDRRWPESYRVMGLRGVEMVLIGYNTMTSYPSTPELDHLTSFHNHLPMQANAYCNATWVLASARVGTEEGVSQIGGSCIISPTGEIVAMASSAAPGLVVAEIDLDFCQVLKKDRFNMRAHRRPEAYGLITAPVEDTWPPLALD